MKCGSLNSNIPKKKTIESRVNYKLAASTEEKIMSSWNVIKTLFFLPDAINGLACSYDSQTFGANLQIEIEWILKGNVEHSIKFYYASFSIVTWNGKRFDRIVSEEDGTKGWQSH